MHWRVCVGLALLSTVWFGVAPTSAFARPGGIFNATSCTGGTCHGSSDPDTTSFADFPSSVIAGQSYTINVSVAGDNDRAGFSLVVTDGSLSLPGAMARVNPPADSATHTGHTAEGDGWTVRWTAPSTAGSVSWTLAGNSVNGTGTRFGDFPQSGFTSGTIDVNYAQGATCGAGSECSTGRCVDDVCCDAVCGASCEACSFAAGSQAATGTCGALRAGVPGANAECCGGTEVWDGSMCVPGCSLPAVNCDTNPDACVTLPASPFWECMCPGTGYDGNGVGPSGCTDRDECDPNPCGSGTCVEEPVNTTVEGYRCNCLIGYRAPALGGTCSNIDECASAPPESAPYDGFAACDPGTCAELSPGSFWSCSCPPTHEVLLRVDGREVCDLNECVDATGGRCASEATCTNIIGGNICNCNMGYRDRMPITVMGQVCDDIDECAEGLETCDVNAMCANVPGSYNCTCSAGWEGSGFSCSDVDECADGTDGCGLNELCVNNVGAPNDCLCVPGFSRTAAGEPCLVQCGDGLVGRGEECDDTNAVSLDGCSETCEVEPGWACFEPGGGPSTCTETCGDGLVDAAEECDDGAGNDDDAPDACRTDCELASCGDGVRDTGEECDDGSGNSDDASDGCRTSCDAAYCGDGVIDAGEICDPGGGLPGTAVAGQCTLLCFPDAGLDMTDPPVLTGGACSCRAVGAPGGGAGPWALLALLGLLFRAPFPKRRA